MKAGDLVKHNLSEGGYIRVIVQQVEPTCRENKTYFVLWEDGRLSECSTSYLNVVEEKLNESR